MPAAIQPHVFESGDRIYLVAPVTPIEIDDQRRDEFASSSPVLADLKQKAPNENLLWLQGNYVEADNANANGHEWTADELSIKSLTPMLCPVTVMHDPTQPVGVIADVALRTPQADQVPRARIESVMAIWAHRHPEIAAEIMHNYEAGTLMQSMECQAPFYSCGECGQTFHKLPNGAESANWCAHLSESANARRILGGVTFTGTGLIFGSRGAKGAYSEANLEIAVKEEIIAAHQELHERASKPGNTQRRVIPMDKMEIDRDEYVALSARPTKDELASVTDERDKLRDEKAEADRKAEAAEIAQKAAEKERDDLKTAKEAADETARQATLGGERMGKFGKAFKEALTDNISTRLAEQAKNLSDDDWEARVAELEELTGKKRDEGGTSTASDNGDQVTTEETASARLNGGGAGNQASTAARSSVIGGLVGNVGGKKKAAA